MSILTVSITFSERQYKYFESITPGENVTIFYFQINICSTLPKSKIDLEGVQDWINSVSNTAYG